MSGYETRYSTEAERADIKLRTRDLVKANAGVEAAGDFTRVARSSLSNFCNGDQADSFIPADVILDLERRCGQPLVTRALAQAQGYRLVLAEGAGDADVAAIVRLAQDAAGTDTSRQSRLLAALADGRLDAAELDDLVTESDRALMAERRLNDALRAARAHAGGGRRS